MSPVRPSFLPFSDRLPVETLKQRARDPSHRHSAPNLLPSRLLTGVSQQLKHSSVDLGALGNSITPWETPLPAPVPTRGHRVRLAVSKLSGWLGRPRRARPAVVEVHGAVVEDSQAVRLGTAVQDVDGRVL